MKKIINIVIFTFILLSIFGLSEVYSYYGPRAVLTETITGEYDTPNAASSGIMTSFSSQGSIDVYVPNTDDVLQYVRLNLSTSNPDTTVRTNIRNWNGTLTAYRDYAMSNPTLLTATPMYMNTTAGNQKDSYTPDVDWAPSFNLSMSVTNTRGGDDLYSENDIIDGQNILQFNFTIINPASSKNFLGTNNITYNITFEPERNAPNSSVSILSSTITVTGGGTAWARDNDGSTDYDTIEWQGKLTPGQQVDIVFNASAVGGNNYAGTSNDLNDDGTTIGANASYFNNTHVITEITFAGSFARGPIREGIDLMKGTDWLVKTYVKNMANNSVASSENALTYNLTAWRIYNVTESTGAIGQLIDSNNTLNEILAADAQYKIPNWVTAASSSDKPYIAPYFDWYVFWNDTDEYTYSGSIITTMTLPTLYEIDTTSSKIRTGTFAPVVYGQKLFSYNVTALHTGNSDSEVESGKIQINSITPWQDVAGGGYANLTVKEDTYKVYFKNTTGTYELNLADSELTVTVTQSAASTNGSIVVYITDLSKVDRVGAAGDVGVNMTTNDEIILYYEIWTYDVGGGDSGIGDSESFHFDGNHTLWTPSGTYITVSSSQTETASQNSIDAYKQLISYDPSTPYLVNVTLNVSVTGTIDNIKFVDYIPSGMTNYTVVSMSSSSEALIFNRTYLGAITTSDGFSMDAWEITNATDNDGWNLTTGQSIQFTYQLNLSTPGLYILPVQIAGFDPGVNMDISISRYGSIKYVIPEKMKSLVIDEDNNFQLFNSVIVGKPGSWRESFNIYNPNSKPVKAQFRTEVFKDSFEYYATYYDDYGKKIEESVDSDTKDDNRYIFWESTLRPHESRSYELRVLTPPVAKVDWNVEVLEKLKDKHVKLHSDIVIKNFAEESYKNIKLHLNIPKDNIFELVDAFDKPLSYVGDDSSTTVTIPHLAGNSVMTISVTYKQSYPTIIITPERTRYDNGEIANLEILIINGGETITNPSIETEIFTEGRDMVYADILRLEKSIEPLEKTELSTRFLVPLDAPTGRYIANVRFSEDMNVITDSSIDFYVLGMKGDEKSNTKVAVIVLLGIVLIYFAYKRLVRVTNK